MNLTKEEEVLILRYNDEKCMFTHKKERVRLSVCFISLLFLGYIYCSLFLKASYLDLAIYTATSAFLYVKTVNKSMIRKYTRQSRYQGFGVASICHLWLNKNIFGVETKAGAPHVIFKVFSSVAAVIFILNFFICLAIHAALSRFFSYDLFICSVAPLFLASIIAWIDGGYRDAWHLTDFKARALVRNCIYLTQIRLASDQDKNVFLKNNFDDTKIDEIVSDMRRDPEIKWVFEKTYS